MVIISAATQQQAGRQEDRVAQLTSSPAQQTVSGCEFTLLLRLAASSQLHLHSCASPSHKALVSHSAHTANSRHAIRHVHTQIAQTVYVSKEQVLFNGGEPRSELGLLFMSSQRSPSGKRV